MWFSLEKEEAQKNLNEIVFLEKNFKQTFNVFNQAGKPSDRYERKSGNFSMNFCRVLFFC